MDALRRAHEWFLTDEAFASDVYAFLERNCKLVSEDAFEEQKLEYSDLHADYCALIESRVEAFVESQGYELAAFFEALRKAHDAFDEAEPPPFSLVLMSAVDYSIFMMLMRQTKRGSRWDMESMFSM